MNFSKLFIILFLFTSFVQAQNNTSTQASIKKQKITHSFLFGYQLYSSKYDAPPSNLPFDDDDRHSSYMEVGKTIQYKFNFAPHTAFSFGAHIGATVQPARFNKVVYLPIGLQSNFHFYKFIDSKTKRNFKSDKLDLYIGANFGFGPIFNSENTPSGFHYGPHFGLRYWPHRRVGVNFEIGTGSCIGCLGIVLK